MSDRRSLGRIGLVLQSERHAGGVFQYGYTMLQSLRRLIPDDLLVFAPADQASRELLLRDCAVAELPRGSRALARKAYLAISRTLARRGLLDPGRRTVDPVLRAWFGRYQPKLLIYPATVATSFESRRPYLVAVHDLQHCLHPEFPEVSADGELERRHYMFGNAIRYAVGVLADSAVGKEDILNAYAHTGITPDRVHVLPFLPPPRAFDVSEAEIADMRQRYELPERFFFYPAQFWSHKNHVRIVRAFKLLEERGARAVLVLTGSHRGAMRERTYRDVLREIDRCGMADKVRILGYVGEEDIPRLYAAAAGLVMPTFFGPTNIPILEAWAYGCPVISSDIRGIREQVGDAGLLVDPFSVDAIGDAVASVWSNQDLRCRLIAAGRRKLSEYTQEDFDSRLDSILEQAGRIVAGNGGSD